jgi:trk system potassium uptake protein TrkA
LQTGIRVKIIEKNAARCEELCQLLPKAEIVNADGTDNKVMLEEGIAYAESLVSLINIDEENILLSLFAKSQTENCKIITKINRIAYDEVISKLDLDTIIYPKNTTADYVVKFVRAKQNSMGSSNIETMHRILDGKAEALEFVIREDSPVVGVTLEKLNIKKNVLVACINRNGQIIIPRGADSINIGDTVIVVTTHSGVNDINDILE